MFRKIGQYEISADGDVILVWASPVFNVETVREYAADMAEMIDSMPPKFGVLAQFDTPPIVGPEVETSMRESARQRAQRGMVAVALVTGDDFGMSIASGQWNRIYGPVGVNHAFFSNPEHARVWLREQIDGASRPK